MSNPFNPGHTIRTGCKLDTFEDTGLVEADYSIRIENTEFDCNGFCGGSGPSSTPENDITNNLIEATDDLTFSDGNFELTSNVVFDYTINLYNANLDCKYRGISNGNPLGSNDGIVLHDGSSAVNCGVYGFNNGFVLHDDTTVSDAIASGNKGHGFYLVGDSTSVGPISIASGNKGHGFYLEGDYSSVSGSISIQNFNNGIVLAGNHNVINNFRAEGNLGFGVEVMEAGSSVGPSGFFCNNYDDDLYFRESAVLTGNIFFDTLTGTPSGDYTPNSCLYSHFLPPVSDETCEDITDELGGLNPETTSISIINGCYTLSSNINIPYNINLYNASLDCQGYTIGYGGDGVEVWGVAGLRLFNNSVVENCVVEGFSKGFDLYDSSSVDSSTALITYIGFNLIGSDSSVSNSFAQESHLLGFYLIGNHSNVAGSTALGSDYLGFFLQGDYSSVTSSTASGNNWFGFYLGSSHNSHSSVSDSFASGNGYGFFLLGNDDTVANSVADGNSNSGFHMWTSSTISNSIASGNGGNGFVLHGDYALVSDSTASGNNKNGFFLQGDYASITDFTARNNLMQGVQVENENILISSAGRSCNNTNYDFMFEEEADFTGEFTYDTVTGSYSGTPTQINCDSDITLSLIDASSDLTLSDSSFDLTSNVVFDYTINLYNASLDCHGYNISNGNSGNDGIILYDSSSAVNCNVDGFFNGFYLWGDYSSVTSSTSSGNSATGFLLTGDYSSVAGSTASLNNEYGFVLEGYQASITDFTARNNLMQGVQVENTNSLIGPVGLSCDNTYSDFQFDADDAINWSNMINMTETVKLTASDAAEEDVFGISVSIDGDYAAIGSYWDDDDGLSSGSVYIFKRDDDGNWSEQAKLTASDAAENDQFGRSVSIDEDYAVIGAYLDDDAGGNAGAAYIFKRDGAGWSEQAKLTASDGVSGVYFGSSVSISGDYAVIGAYADDNDAQASGSGAGAAYIFKRDGAGWSEQAKLTASDAATWDYFGISVAISGDYAVIGAYGADDDAGGSPNYMPGAAYIFKRDGAGWSQQAKLTANGPGFHDYFGRSVSIDEDYAVIGARYDDNYPDYPDLTGSAYIFKRDDDVWNQQAMLITNDVASGQAKGFSVAISGETVVVGAYSDNDAGHWAGSANIFRRDDDGNWNEQAKFFASDPAEDDQFGRYISIDGASVIIGAYGNDDAGESSGSAYIFEESTITFTGEFTYDTVTGSYSGNPTQIPCES